MQKRHMKILRHQNLTSDNSNCSFWQNHMKPWIILIQLLKKNHMFLIVNLSSASKKTHKVRCRSFQLHINLLINYHPAFGKSLWSFWKTLHISMQLLIKHRIFKDLDQGKVNVSVSPCFIHKFHSEILALLNFNKNKI